MLSGLFLLSEIVGVIALILFGEVFMTNPRCV